MLFLLLLFIFGLEYWRKHPFVAQVAVTAHVGYQVGPVFDLKQMKRHSLMVMLYDDAVS